MSYGGHPYGGVGYAASDVAEIPDADVKTSLAVEVSFTTGALETPVWVDITPDVRSWDVSRGRNRELERFQPGRASVVLDNRDRDYDSQYASGPWFGNLKPMRRIRIRETFNGVTYPVFDGYVDRWQLDYPLTGKDATATVTATDGFKIHNRTDLPVSVYDDTVLADAPDLYWRLDETKNAAEDSGLRALNSGTLGSTADGTYLGPPQFGGERLVVNDPGTSIGIVSDDSAPGTGDFGVQVAAANFSLNPTITTAWVAELWCIPAQDPGVNGTLFCQRAAGGSVDIHAYYTASNTFVLNVFADATDYSVSTSPTTYPTHARYHLVYKVVPGESVKLWVNGVLHDDADVMGPDYDELPGTLSIGTLGSSGGFNWDGPISHFAVWRGTAATAVDQTWVDRHYAAGTAPWSADLTGARIGRVLDEGEWPAGLREIDTGLTSLQSADLVRQTVLEHMQKAAETEFGLLFQDRTGKVRYVDRNRLFGRVPDPAVFGDDTGEVGYRQITFDDGDAVVRNRATISRLNGVAKTAESAASVDEFGRFDYRLEGLLHSSDNYSQDYANLVRDEYDEPRRRVTSLTLGPADAGNASLVVPQMLGRELGDAITVKHTPPGGGDRFEQTCVVEGIRHAGSPGGLSRQTTFVLSPEFSVRALEDEEVATLGYAETTANQTGMAAGVEVDATGLSVTVTVGANRYIRISTNLLLQRSVADNVTVAYIKEGATYLQVLGIRPSTAAIDETLAGSIVIDSPSAGSHTYKIATDHSGTGTRQITANSTRPAFILVEDIGPS